MIKPIHLIPSNTDIKFLNLRYYSLGLSSLIVFISLMSTFLIGLNFGIDFRGGVLFELRANDGLADISQLRSKLGNLSLGEVSIQEFGNESDVLVRVQKQEGDDKYQADRISMVKDILSTQYEIRRTEFVGPTVGEELKRKGFWAVVLALTGILLYIWFRFEWQFAIAAIIALFHDVLITIGLFVFTGFEFNLSTVAAVLTIAGYSINDTVVVFDRLRENLRKYKSLDQYHIMNQSLNETLSRTITTSVTTLLALASIYFLGGEVLANFSLAMMWGVLIGTYSSIFVAASLLAGFRLRRGDDDNDDDLSYFKNG